MHQCNVDLGRHVCHCPISHFFIHFFAIGSAADSLIAYCSAFFPDNCCKLFEIRTLQAIMRGWILSLATSQCSLLTPVQAEPRTNSHHTGQLQKQRRLYSRKNLSGWLQKKAVVTRRSKIAWNKRRAKKNKSASENNFDIHRKWRFYTRTRMELEERNIVLLCTDTPQFTSCIFSWCDYFFSCYEWAWLNTISLPCQGKGNALWG